ncbi:hypothetical protein BJ508DRAFT_415190 [Ascobolus immersus RN42]|uniref:DUF6594 domain-containing protein n=1 Tax=Ascobolus immersus RN42 TaxID=1160509 RepID=A0A3N4I5H5_ASCIM|nr:hypothetical protein BJ508DRAFT_415190 [Ascobolus immersus RN42]
MAPQSTPYGQTTNVPFDPNSQFQLPSGSLPAGFAARTRGPALSSNPGVTQFQSPLSAPPPGFAARPPAAPNSTSSGQLQMPLPLPLGFSVRAPVPPTRQFSKEDDFHKVPNGYPSVASFIRSANEFSIFERFDYLRVRVLLNKQAELVELEQKLRVLDANDAGSLGLVSSKDDRNTERAGQIKVIEMKLQEYDATLDSYLKYRERPQPKKRNIRSVRNWLNWKMPLSTDDLNIVRDDNDLVSVATGDEYGLIELWISRGSELTKSLLAKLNGRTRQPIFLSDPAKTNDIARTITTFLTSVSLVAPIIILQKIPEAFRLWTTCIFTVSFAVAISYCTKSRAVDIFTATAAYVFSISETSYVFLWHP